jgi:hypothetical protein
MGVKPSRSALYAKWLRKLHTYAFIHVSDFEHPTHPEKKNTQNIPGECASVFHQFQTSISGHPGML